MGALQHRVAPPNTVGHAHTHTHTTMLRTTFAATSRASLTLAARQRVAAVRPTLAVRMASTEVAAAQQVVPTQEDMERDPQLAGLGYPQLPQVSRQLRPAKAGWWDEQERINFGETLPESDDTLSMWAPDVHKIPASKAAFHLSVAAGCIALFASLVYVATPERPGIKRTYPYDGLVKELSGTDDQQYAVVDKPAGGEEEEEEE